MFKHSLDEQASLVLHQIGKVKESTDARRADKKISPPKGKFAEVQHQVRTILRAVMRKPNNEILSQLGFLHGKIKENFASMSDEAITFLLSYSASEARGGFTNKVTKEVDIEKFRRFLATDPSTMEPQSLLTKIETILAAMGYLYSADMAETKEEKNMFANVEALMKDNMAARIKAAYPSRADDLAPKENSSYFTVEPEDVSSASEVEEENRYQLELPKSKFFRKGQEGNLSWPAAAVESGIPVRAHVSASSTLLLPAIDGLYNSGTNKSDWFKNDENAKMLCGALLIPTLERADYHTIAETAAGVTFYLNDRAKRKDSSIENKPMTPSQAFKEALSMLEHAASDETTNFQQMSLQHAIRLTKPKLIELTEEIKTLIDEKRITY